MSEEKLENLVKRNIILPLSFLGITVAGDALAQDTIRPPSPPSNVRISPGPLTHRRAFRSEKGDYKIPDPSQYGFHYFKTEEDTVISDIYWGMHGNLHIGWTNINDTLENHFTALKSAYLPAIEDGIRNMTSREPSEEMGGILFQIFKSKKIEIDGRPALFSEFEIDFPKSDGTSVNMIYHFAAVKEQYRIYYFMIDCTTEFVPESPTYMESAEKALQGTLSTFKEILKGFDCYNTKP